MIAAQHVTIFADASFCPKTKAAGWAAWMKGNGKPAHTAGGRIMAAVPQSYDAETFAVVNALYAARSAGYITTGQIVMIQSDCLLPLGLIASRVPGAQHSQHADGLPVLIAEIKKPKRKRKKLTMQANAALQAILKLVSETSITLVVRHVRGHQPERGRAWVNEECDRIAKRYMRDARRELQTKGIAA